MYACIQIYVRMDTHIYIMCMYIYVCVCIPSKQKYGPGNVPLFGRNLRPRCVAKITTDAMMMPTSQDVRIFNHSDWQKKQGESSGTEWNKKNMLKNIKNESYIVRDIECSCLPKQWAFLKEYICEEQLCLGFWKFRGNFRKPVVYHHFYLPNGQTFQTNPFKTNVENTNCLF